MTRARFRKELRDQGAHFVAGLVILAPIALAPSFVTGAIAGFGVGLVRELTEEGEISLPALRSALGSKLDLSFWTLAGTIVGAIAGLIA